KEFYKETFGNEVFLTDIVGILDGPLGVANVLEALIALNGQGTTNLRVRVPENVVIGGRRFQEGSYFDTGLDVPKGSWAPLGLAISFSGWKLRAGITCAACHATVDPVTLKVVEGAPNQDLNAGLLLALASNSSAYFMHTDVRPLQDVPLTNTKRGALPDTKALEDAVDAELLMWPRGNFDSVTDMKADPTQLPTSFTWGNHPYGWSGNFMAGPFRGLSSQNNNVHALNSDSTLLADSSRFLFDMDKETYLAILLCNAATKKYRYDVNSGIAPSEFLSRVKPEAGSPGINQVVLSPTYPKGTILTPDGTLTSSPEYAFWTQNNAMSAWQNTIVPPPPTELDARTALFGKQVFERAGCPACHSGVFLTNNRVVPVSQIGANAVRAKALEKTELNFAAPVLYTFDTAVPLPRNAQTTPVPMEGIEPAQIDLAWAHHGSPGGYKVPSLVGLNWSAPYLHDGGVAVGRNANSDLGLPGTVQRNVLPDPPNSLRALVDRSLRSKVVAANRASPDLRRMNVEGIGHEYWVDSQGGFSAQEQSALIDYLLAYDPSQ
ncbi:MAG: hypothetical protein JO061_21590, partial [Acidobacteriaceae bacterium]|nr:hypothetical protein [Acidobacteriaceae bacterium]